MQPQHVVFVVRLLDPRKLRQRLKIAVAALSVMTLVGARAVTLGEEARQRRQRSHARRAAQAAARLRRREEAYRQGVAAEPLDGG